VESKLMYIYATFGKHLLVNNEIDVEKLINYIEGKIDEVNLSQETDLCFEKEVDSKKTYIFFNYREISILQKIYEKVSKIDYTEKLKKPKISLEEVEEKLTTKSKKIQSYINTIPLNSNIEKTAEMLNEKYNYENKIGKLYKYNENEIFIYDHSINEYKGKVFKKGSIYTMFTDKISDGYLIRQIGENEIYIKNNKLEFIETNINSQIIKSLPRSIINDDKIFVFDIECYIDESSNFIPFSCA
jgi:hypothetical protein